MQRLASDQSRKFFGAKTLKASLMPAPPADEYTPEAIAILASMMEVEPEDGSKDRSAQIVGSLVREVWAIL
jgi:hypothetical protein